MKIIIAGGGKIGFYLAQMLLSHGHDPHVIEKKKALCEELANLLDAPVTRGDASMVSVLESAETQDADALVSVTGRDEDNLIICQLAKRHFGVARTIARVNNPKNAEVMKRLGVDIPLSSTDTIVHLLEREIDTSAIKLLASINQGEASLSELEIPARYRKDGIRVSELDMPMESILVSVLRDGQLIIPRGNTQIFSGDHIIIMSKNTALHDISRALSLG